MLIENGFPGVSVVGSFQVYWVFQRAPSQQRSHVAEPLVPTLTVTSLPYGFSISFAETKV
jgi:hypothetical protein